MSSYFDFLKKRSGAGGSGGYEPPNVSHTKGLETPQSITSQIHAGVISEPFVTAASTTITTISAEKDADMNYLYHERAGILQYDGELSQSEAERLAYQETLLIYMEETHPAIAETFQNIILNNSGENL